MLLVEWRWPRNDDEPCDWLSTVSFLTIRNSLLSILLRPVACPDTRFSVELRRSSNFAAKRFDPKSEPIVFVLCSTSGVDVIDSIVNIELRSSNNVHSESWTPIDKNWVFRFLILPHTSSESFASEEDDELARRIIEVGTIFVACMGFENINDCTSSMLSPVNELHSQYCAPNSAAKARPCIGHKIPFLT